MFKFLVALAAAALSLVILPAIAFAAESAGTSVTIPWGDWIYFLISNFGEVVLALVGLAAARLLAILPKPISDFLKTLQVEQLLDRAIEYGISATSGAVKGRELSINVGSAVLAEALGYVLSRGPGALIRWMGGEDAIREMILARLDLEETSDATKVISLSKMEKIY